MKIHQRHSWNVDLQAAKEIQMAFKNQIEIKPIQQPIQFIAGADVAYSRKLNLGFSVISIFNYPKMQLIEQQYYTLPVNFPYVPGYLTFREAPVLLKAFEKINIIPDLVLVDGQGIAHPRQFGIASHLGLFLNLPTIGCAKSRLVGNFNMPAFEKGSQSDLIFEGKIIGKVVRTRTNIKPVFVSPGHKIALNQSVEWILKTCLSFRIPEPIRQSHIAVNKLRSDLEMASSEAILKISL